MLVQTKQLEEAEGLYAEYIAVLHVEIIVGGMDVTNGVGGAVDLGRFEQAEAPLLEGYRRFTNVRQTKKRRTRGVLHAMVIMYEHTNRPEEAAKYQAEFEKLQPSTQPTTRHSR